jgi:pimeloyl-ACP methyl ester carboxylesterase
VKILLKHLTVAGLIFLLFAGTASPQPVSGNTFRVFVRGSDTGSEEVTLLDSPGGYILRGSGRLNAPLNLTTDYWEARYDRAWKPLELTVNFSQGSDRWTVHTTVSGTNAYSDVTQNDKNQRRNHIISADAIFGPNLIFGAYEALATRLVFAKVGDQLQVLVAPQDVVPVSVARVSNETIEVPGRKIAARRWTLHFGAPTGALDMDVWVEGSRLLRVDIPSQMLSVVRTDIASVAARLVTLGRANDEPASIPANGFSLAATISKPVDSRAARLPAVVLVSGSALSERDEIVAGIPIFAQLATALADAGYLVVRYDERGAGQSGGRAESATYEDFAADVRAVVTYLGKRKDIDPRRIAILGYGDGGWVSMLVASRESKVAALGLLATAGVSGTEVVLEQQRRLFDGSASEGARQAAIEQQKRILQAVVSGKGWEMIPPDIRKRVDTPLYRSFLTFDPAPILSKTRQPLMIVQGALDKEVPPAHGEQLAQLGRSRTRARATDFVQVPGVNHLLAPATTGEVAEYGTLEERNVSPAVVAEIGAWLKKALAPEMPR